MGNNYLGLMLIILFVGGFYAYLSYAQQTIANKIGVPNSWFAWVPLLSFYLLVKMSGKPTWWLLLLLVPLVNIVVLALIWMRVVQAIHKPSWLGILMLLSPINMLVLGYLAFWDSNNTSIAGAPVTSANAPEMQLVTSASSETVEVKNGVGGSGNQN